MVRSEMSRAQLRARAESGDAHASYALACRLGWSAAREAVRYFRNAAEQGHSEAQAFLGHCYARGRGVRPDPRMAARWLWSAAALGSNLARMDVEQERFVGRATQRELNRLRLRDAAKGDAASMYELGSSYLRGRGTRKDPRRAARWMLAAARSGHDEAWSGLDDLADEGFVRARDVLPHLRRAAAGGDARSQYWLGLKLEWGDGVRRNRREALRWIRRSAAQGEGRACLRLANAYRSGRGVRQSWPRALGYYRRAAAEGQGNAFAWLIEYYDGRSGAPRDARAVATWLRRAEAVARRGNTDVYTFLDDYYGFVDDPDEAIDARRAVRWVRRGAAEDDPDCLMRLGIHLFDGTGTRKDRARGLALYRRAAEMGSSRAAYLLGRCHAEGDGVRRDRRRARRWLERAAADGETDARRALARLRRA